MVIVSSFLLLPVLLCICMCIQCLYNSILFTIQCITIHFYVCEILSLLLLCFVSVFLVQLPQTKFKMQMQQNLLNLKTETKQIYSFQSYEWKWIQCNDKHIYWWMVFALWNLHSWFSFPNICTLFRTSKKKWIFLWSSLNIFFLYTNSLAHTHTPRAMVKLIQFILYIVSFFIFFLLCLSTKLRLEPVSHMPDTKTFDRKLCFFSDSVYLLLWCGCIISLLHYYLILIFKCCCLKIVIMIILSDYEH